MAKKQPQPPQPSLARATRSKGKNGSKQTLQPPQPSLAEAQAEAKAKAPGNQAQPPQLTLGAVPIQGLLQAQPPQPPLGNVLNQDKQKVKPRRRRGRKGRKLPRTVPNTNKRSRDGEECEQAEVNSQSKRLRVDSPPVLRQDGENDAERNVPVLPIKPKAFPPRRSFTPFFPRPFNSKSSTFNTPKLTKSQRSSLFKTYNLPRSKTYRANLKAERDFPRTLESLTCISNSDTDSEYTPIPLADSVPTSGQSTPEASPEPISNEDLFGLLAKPCSPAPSTPSLLSLSSDDVS